MGFKKHFYSLLLLSLIALKVASAALHLYLHHDSEDAQSEHCELCEHAIQNQDTEATGYVQFFQLESTPLITFSELNEDFEVVYQKKTAHNALFCRPPPSLG